MGVCTIANPNGRSARTVTSGGGGAETANAMPVTAAASVPHSSTVMVARWIAWLMTTGFGVIAEKSAAGVKGLTRPSCCNAPPRSIAVAKSHRGRASWTTLSVPPTGDHWTSSRPMITHGRADVVVTLRNVEPDDAMAVFAALEREAVEYVVVGAVAMALHGEVRATLDLDLFVAPDEVNVSRLRRALQSVFSDPDIEEITSTDLTGEFPVVRYVPPSEAYAIDLISRLGDAFDFEDIEWETMHRDAVAIRVATPRMLLRMKSGTLRPQDRLDAERLRQRFGLVDE